jgi:hypothetical protein
VRHARDRGPAEDAARPDHRDERRDSGR